MQNKEIGYLRGRINELDQRVGWLEKQCERLVDELSDTRRNCAKECANYIANETFITRMSEDMFMTSAREQVEIKGDK